LYGDSPGDQNVAGNHADDRVVLAVQREALPQNFPAPIRICASRITGNHYVGAAPIDLARRKRTPETGFTPNCSKNPVLTKKLLHLLRFTQAREDERADCPAGSPWMQTCDVFLPIQKIRIEIRGASGLLSRSSRVAGLGIGQRIQQYAVHYGK